MQELPVADIEFDYYSGDEGVELISHEEEPHHYNLGWEAVGYLFAQSIFTDGERIAVIPAQAHSHTECATPFIFSSLLLALTDVVKTTKDHGEGFSTLTIKVFLGTPEDLQGLEEA